MQLHDFAEASKPYVRYIDFWCSRYQYSQLKAYTQIAAESGFNADAVSPTGAIGLCQIEPYTASAWNVNPYDPEDSIKGLVGNMAIYEKQFGHFSLALAAYNAGEGAVAEYHGVPPYPETQEYVETITDTVASAYPFWVPFWKELLT
jgi:soluble lytic murein transglycosylase-like protein